MAATVPPYDPNAQCVEWLGFDTGTVHGTSDGELLAVYCRGHVDPNAFWRQAVKEFAKEEVDEDEIPLAAHVRHETWRKVPVSGECMMRFVKAKEGSRGAFLVTVLSLREWIR